jgi:hypothetical protein
MYRALSVIGLSAAMLFAGVTASSAVTMSIVDSSPQGGANTAGVTYAVGYNASTPINATWTSGDDPTVIPPPGNSSGVYQSPFNSNGLTNSQSYFSVFTSDSEGDGAPSPATLTFSDLQNSFSLLWGSIDTYNTLEFLNSGGTAFATFVGADIMTALGIPVVTNSEMVALVNFVFGTGEEFQGVRFSSSQAAFEFALVPLPAAGLLLLAGIGGLFGVSSLRRRQGSTTA